MSDLFEKSMETLELPRVLELLAAQAVTQEGKERALSLRPETDPDEVRRRLQETTAAVDMMVLKGSPSFSGVKPVAGNLQRADMGGSLNTRELLDIAGVLAAARSAKDYGESDAEKKTVIDQFFRSLHPNRFLEDKITGSIVGDGELADSASPELASIRRHMRATESKVRDILQKIISSSQAKYLQEAIITQRSGRYVVPVKSEYKNEIPGLVHDLSGSGSTFFIEPMGVVKANNELRELKAREEKEIDRILAELSAECAAFKDDISEDYALLIRLDGIFARGRLSVNMEAMEPALSRKSLFLKKARHPLLDKKTAVANDLSLGEGFDTLVITGPNTGGKTVTLKTIGLITLMAQCGLHIPASDGSAVRVFDRVLADIGDEQSIAQSLSTFSSHMSNIVGMLEETDPDTLILFDELGGGTDPVEGAALAAAIIEHARGLGALVAATTHYAELKVYAMTTAGVENASCEFDVETLAPTYRLLVGIPGKSNAFAISKRLGLSDEIIEDAKGRVSSESQSFELTIEKLEQTRLLLEKDREEAAKKLREAQENAKKAAFMKAELEVRLDKADTKSRREAERILADARATAEEVFRELDEMRKMADQDEDASRVNEARAQLRRQLNLSQEALQKELNPEAGNQVSARPVKPGDTVQIKSMGMKATVIDKSPDGTLSLRAGIMNVTAKEDEVLLLENEQAPKQKSAPKGGGGELRSLSIKPEVDLRGMEAVEAVLAAERYLDAAVMAKLKTVTIIHGKGTGALRTAIQQMLKKNKFVKSFRLGRYGEGESGVTVVELK